MNYGLYLSASGVLTNRYCQDVFSNNLANVNTPGYKPDIPLLTAREPEAVEDIMQFEFSDELLDRLGGGVFAGPQFVDTTSSPARRTEGLLDAAIVPDNTYFVVQSTEPTESGQSVRLTRTGEFVRNDEGYLVTAAGGYKVLDATGRPIQLDLNAALEINSSAQLLVNGEAAHDLALTSIADPARLRKQGENLLTWDGPADLRIAPPTREVKPGFIELSGVNPVKALTQVIESTKALTASGNLIRYHDLLMDRAVNTLGVVA